jgi:hypothetical protein
VMPCFGVPSPKEVLNVWPVADGTTAPSMLCSSYLWRAMLLDIFYVLIGLAFFVLCWLFTKACDHL